MSEAITTTTRRARLLLSLAAIAVAFAAADTYVVVMALPDMMGSVGLSITALQEATPIISGFLLGYIAVLPLIGRLSDMTSRQKILLWCLVLFVVGSAITALAVELNVLVTGRVLQGLGGGGLVPATLALVADLWPADKRGTPLGIVGAVQEFGAVIGPLVGALILHYGTWRDIFWVSAIGGVLLAAGIWVVARGLYSGGDEPTGRRMPWWWKALVALVALVTVALAWLTLTAPEALVTDIDYGVPFIPFSEDSTSRVATPIGLATGVGVLVLALMTAPWWAKTLWQADLIGALLIGTALGCLVLTFSSSDPEKEVVGPMGWTLLPVGAVALLLYLWRHRTAARPLIDRGVIVARVRPGMVASFFLGVALVAVVVNVPILARVTGTDSQTEAAMVLLRFLIAVPVGAIIGGWLLSRLGPGIIAGAGFLLACGGLGVMSTWGEGSLDHWSSWVVLVVVGLGTGLPIAPINDAALADAEHDAHGVVSALVVVARMVGMVVGLALLTAYGLRRFRQEVEALPEPVSPSDIQGAAVVQSQAIFMGAAVCAAVAAIVAIVWLGRSVIKRERGRAIAGL